MSASYPAFAIPKLIANKVSQLKALVRLYVGLEGIAAVLVVLGAAFWAGLAIDWFFEPRPATRAVMWFAVGSAVGATAFKYLLRRIMAPLPADSLALLVERKHPELREGLVTIVQAADSGHQHLFERRLIDRTAAQTARMMPEVRLGPILQWRPLVRKAIAAGALTASIAVFALWAPDAFGFWLRRLQFERQPWPRLAELSVEGFDDVDGAPTARVARGDEFELRVFASIVDDHQAPDEVEVRWRRLADGGRGGGLMRRIGEATPGRDQRQEYAYAFKAAGDMEIDVIGGDDRIDDLQLLAVTRPTVTAVALDCEFPAYTRLSPRSITASNRVELPEGTRATFRLTASKPLAAAQILERESQMELASIVDEDAPERVSFELPSLTEGKQLSVRLTDQAGVESLDPYRLTIIVQADEAPEASVQLRGIGVAVTANATIPIEGRLSDEYGLVRAWLECQVDESVPLEKDLPSDLEGLREVRLAERFDLMEVDPETDQRRLTLRPGQRIGLSVRAADAWDLGTPPHIGSSQKFLLDVVTPSQLRAQLERRELGLRQRFEAIYEKMLGTRDMLGRIDLAESAGGAEDGGAEDGGVGDSDGPREAADDSRRLRQRDLSRVAGARQNATQLAFETLGVADGFDDIVAEMMNNRVDTEELTSRLSRGIAEPLRDIGSAQLTAFEERLDELQAILSGDVEARADAALALAVAAADDTLAAMKETLDRMLELESYNELVDLLRSILEEQRKLNDATKEQRRAKLRSLLED